MIQAIERLLHSVSAAGELFQSPFLLLIRLYWGWQFMQTGWGKLSNFDQVSHFFANLGLPVPGALGLLIGILELVGGLLLLLGFLSRLIAIPLMFNMIAAYFFANREAMSSVLSDPGKFYNADPYTFLFAALLVLIFGPGRYSADGFLASRPKPASSGNRVAGASAKVAGT